MYRGGANDRFRFPCYVLKIYLSEKDHRGWSGLATSLMPCLYQRAVRTTRGSHTPPAANRQLLRLSSVRPPSSAWTFWPAVVTSKTLISRYPQPYSRLLIGFPCSTGLVVLRQVQEGYTKMVPWYRLHLPSIYALRICWFPGFPKQNGATLLGGCTLPAEYHHLSLRAT